MKFIFAAMQHATNFSILVQLLFISVLSAQEVDDKVMIQFTGKVFDEFLQPLPFTNIVVTNRTVGQIADKEGKFSFIAFKNDTIQFTSMGFKPKTIVIPDTIIDELFIRDLLMRSDTFLIPEVHVYPWKDYEDFKKQFAELELPESDMQRAARNIAIMKAHIITSREPSRVGNFNAIMEDQYRESMYRGQYPTYQIFNVMAWGEFFQAIQNGDFKKKD